MREQVQNALNDALRLAHYGRPSFPCLDNKKPACPNGFKDATADPERLRELWRKHPGLLVGVPTGDASGLFVIDVDSGRHDEANDWLESVSSHLPETRWHATKSGGWHILFKHRAGLRNTASKLARGVDTRGDGGYIIWWPVHMGLGTPHKLDGDLAELPDWLYDKLVERPSPPPLRRSSVFVAPSMRVRGLLDFIAGAHEGERNASLFWSANRIRDMAAIGELSKSQFDNACCDLAQTAVSLGLPRREAEKTIASAMRGRNG
jgi:Bifunctional DNA primase/polymerase, N-terminal